VHRVPVFEITPVESIIKFDVEASVAITGKFDKWGATLTFTSPELSTAVLDIKIQAATVDTGSGMKNGKLKGSGIPFIKIANRVEVSVDLKGKRVSGPRSTSSNSHVKNFWHTPP
jgi:hypothetical protein